jgi:uridine phosphorylase
VRHLLSVNAIVTHDSTHHREFYTFKCSAAAAESFTCCITGIGSASVEIAVNELVATGGRTFIHTGTSATLRPSRLPVGSAAIVDVAVRDDGASLQYVHGKGRRIPAHPVVLKALMNAAESLNIPFRRVTGLSTDAFYACAASKVNGSIVPANLLPLRGHRPPTGFTSWLLPKLRARKAYCLDMEVATFYTLAQITDPTLRLQWGSVKGVSNQIPFRQGEQNEVTEQVLAKALLVALRALQIIDRPSPS